ncbi:MAG: IS1595 family transposase, partial [Bacteroidales bacterium]|nr:IS1595 family transposase [Bacteroidales bacterium]
MVDIKSFNSLLDLLDALPDERSCIEYLENLRWKDGVVSPFDRTSKVYKLSNHKYMCKNTQNKFNVKTSTIFENTKLPLRKWFTAIWLILSNKKGISSLQLAKNINVTQKTAWLLLQKIRFCMDCKNTNRLSVEVEADETYIGGKSKNRHANKKVKGSQGRSSKCKTPVLGMVQRKGDVVAMVVKNTSMAELTP